SPPPSPLSPPFPSTTLFRSPWLEITEVHYQNGKPVAFADRLLTPSVFLEDGETEEQGVKELRATLEKMMEATKKPILDEHRDFRSEEHTSELQSRENLVCRL